jgi:3-deoxy-D-manno-octulosonic-acid transferase
VGLYNVLLGLLLILAAPIAVLWLTLSPRARWGLGQRLTPLPASWRADVWVHAASVGEAEAVVPLLLDLEKRGISVVVTTQTVTGRETLRRRLTGVPSRLVPLDLAPLARVSFSRVRPRVLVLVETELWPNLIFSARAAGARVLLVSGRISDRSLPRYRRIGTIVRRVLGAVDVIGARSDGDAARFIELGAERARVLTVGDLKLDRPPPSEPQEDVRSAVGRGPLLVAGSTHAGEEEAVLQAFERLRRGAAPELRLLLAPRHVERAPGLLPLARSHGLRAALRTVGGAEADVVILDTIGELASLYRLAGLVFTGGSLVPVGGHNLFEVVQAGRVVVHGPHLQNQRTQVEVLEPLGVLYPVGGADELGATLEALWADPDRHRPAREAAPMLGQHRGASTRSLDLLLEILEKGKETRA